MRIQYPGPVYDKHIALGVNLIVFPWLPVWTWNTHQVNDANAPHDRSILLWYMKDDYRDPHGEEEPDVSVYDTDRMNLFTWKRLEDHLSYLADRGVYSWGFQGFHVKRSFGIFPQDFPDDKYEWYIRYCMARLAPYYNLIWNHTWESGSNSDEFKKLTQEDMYDPWRHLYMQVGSDNSNYDINARDRECCPDMTGTDRPVWSTEGNQLWGRADWALVWKFILNGITPFHVEDPNSTHRQSQPFEDRVDEAQKLVLYPFNYIESRTEFSKLKPHPELSTTTHCLAAPGRQYLVFSDSLSEYSVELEEGNYKVEWLDPKTYTIKEGNGFEWSGGARVFSIDDDFTVLLITATDKEIDTTPPAAVMGLNVGALSDTEVRLRWEPSVDSESGIDRYVVYRDGEEVAGIRDTFYVDRGLSPSTAYEYTVSAVNGDGLEGELSDPVAAQTHEKNERPMVSLIEPADGAELEVDPVIFSAVARDPDGSVFSVEFVVLDGNDTVFTTAGVVSQDSIWTAEWPEPSSGTFDLSAWARDDKGKTGISQAIGFTLGQSTARGHLSGRKRRSVAIRSGGRLLARIPFAADCRIELFDLAGRKQAEERIPAQSRSVDIGKHLGASMKIVRVLSGETVLFSSCVTDVQ